jgi:hypothetical protein
MLKNVKIWLAIAALAGGTIIGCSQDYNDQRPPAGNLDPDNVGLQAKDVQAATDMLAADLLAAPELNQSSTKWTLVVDHMDDMTSERLCPMTPGSANYDIFLSRLKVNLSQLGHGRVQLIENLQKYNDLRSRELSGPQFGQGGAGAPATAVNPEYSLYGKAMDMPNRATNFYHLEFDVTDLKTRETVWTRMYEVQTAR